MWNTIYYLIYQLSNNIGARSNISIQQTNDGFQVDDLSKDTQNNHFYRTKEKMVTTYNTTMQQP
uniref:Putative ovule protein n=1 Tax=Solanum chacoense TaxID=4108 RepID=A0A0V0GN38_SOLCH